MISKEDFNTLFNYLNANPWEWPLDKGKVNQTKTLFFDKLKGYDAKELKVAFDEVIECKMQKAFPSLSRIHSSLEITKPFRTPVQMPLPRHIPKKRRDLIIDLMRSTRKVITVFGNDKEKLKAVIKRFTDGNNEK